MTKRINSVRDLNVYRVAFDAAMEIFDNLDEKYEHIFAKSPCYDGTKSRFVLYSSLIFRLSSIVHRNQKGETKK